jgi:hypothetical protein
MIAGLLHPTRQEWDEIRHATVSDCVRLNKVFLAAFGAQTLNRHGRGFGVDDFENTAAGPKGSVSGINLHVIISSGLDDSRNANRR